jgi:hypothetical protein
VKKKFKPKSLLIYVAICAALDFISVMFIFPEIFMTAAPVSIAFLPRALLFVGWSAIQGTAGFFITRG